MRTIELTRGRVALVDDADFDWLVAMGSWQYINGGYAAGRIPLPDGNKQFAYMHRVILSAGDETDVDHVNGDRLDNRRSNLRVCTHFENCANRGANSNSRSGIKGVRWQSDKRKWQAIISIGG